MKLNIANPTTGQNLPLVIDDDKKLASFFGKRMGQEVPADSLGEGWKNYILKITGGNDKDGFAMKQGILIQGRTRILMSEGHSTYRPRRKGERKKKSVRGCIVGSDLSVLALSVVKQGDAPIEGLNNEKKPRRRGPKRATRIRKLFALDKKKDDPRRYVLLYSRKIEKNGKVHWKTPKIQRLVTDVRLRRKRVFKAEKKAAWEKTKKAQAEYHKLCESLKKKRIAAAVKAAQASKAEEAAKKDPKAATKDTKKVDPKAATKDTKTTGKTTDPKKGTATQGKTPATTTTKKDEPKKDAGKTTTAPKTDTKKVEPPKDTGKKATKK